MSLACTLLSALIRVGMERLCPLELAGFIDQHAERRASAIKTVGQQRRIGRRQRVSFYTHSPVVLLQGWRVRPP